MPRGGHRPGAGRKLGSTSISTTLVREFLATKNFDPIAKLVELYEDKEADLATKIKIATELAQYVAPKLKALDVQGNIKQESIKVVFAIPPRPERNIVQVQPRDLLGGGTGDRSS